MANSDSYLYLIVSSLEFCSICDSQPQELRPYTVCVHIGGRYRRRDLCLEGIGPDKLDGRNTGNESKQQGDGFCEFELKLQTEPCNLKRVWRRLVNIFIKVWIKLKGHVDDTSDNLNNTKQIEGHDQEKAGENVLEQSGEFSEDNGPLSSQSTFGLTEEQVFDLENVLDELSIEREEEDKEKTVKVLVHPNIESTSQAETSGTQLKQCVSDTNRRTGDNDYMLLKLTTDGGTIAESRDLHQGHTDKTETLQLEDEDLNLDSTTKYKHGSVYHIDSGDSSYTEDSTTERKGPLPDSPSINCNWLVDTRPVGLNSDTHGTVLTLYQRQSVNKTIKRKELWPARNAKEKDLAFIAQHIGDGWRLLGASLGVTKVMICHIVADKPGDIPGQIYEMLCKWVQLNVGVATIQTLHEHLIQNPAVLVDWDILNERFSKEEQDGQCAESKEDTNSYKLQTSVAHSLSMTADINGDSYVNEICFMMKSWFALRSY